MSFANLRRKCGQTTNIERRRNESELSLPKSLSCARKSFLVVNIFNRAWLKHNGNSNKEKKKPHLLAVKMQKLLCHILSSFSPYKTCPNICPMYGLVQCTCHHEKASHYNVFQSPVVFSKPVSFQTHCELSSTSVQHHFLSESRFRLSLYVLPQKASKEQPSFQ